MAVCNKPLIECEHKQQFRLELFKLLRIPAQLNLPAQLNPVKVKDSVFCKKVQELALLQVKLLLKHRANGALPPPAELSLIRCRNLPLPLVFNPPVNLALTKAAAHPSDKISRPCQNSGFHN